MPAPDPGAVLVTGASSGIGQACALELDARGYMVFAGVRTEAAAQQLQAAGSERLRALQLDVTDAHSIKVAAERIHDATAERGLFGLVNNAGVAVAGPLEILPVDALREQLEVNVIGQVAVTQAMLPMLRTAVGRIVNVGSISGRVALPFLGPYAASKFAMEALTDALRVELRPWRIHVSIVEPGAVATPIWDRSLKAARAQIERVPREASELYVAALRALRRRVQQLDGIPAEHVVGAVIHALTARRPQARYLVGARARKRLILNWIPWRARDALVARALR